MSSPRVFTVQEVDALIPELNARVGQQLLLRREIDEDLRRLETLTGSQPQHLRSADTDTVEVRALKERLAERIHSYEHTWSQIEDLGAVVKDTSIGLLDFYGRVDDRLVWLCWRYGEGSVRYYHPLDAGYDGRRPLGRRQRERLLN